MLRNTGAIQLPFVSPGGALYQTTRGAQALAQEAAHCLPSQILIGGQDPTTLLVNSKPQPVKILTEIRSEFAKVTVLPSCFNSADKAAERVPNGLVNAFVDSCREVVSCPRLAASPRLETRRHSGERYVELYTVAVWPINREVVNRAYHQIWVPRAQQSYESAGDVIESGSYLSAGDDPDEVLWILTNIWTTIRAYRLRCRNFSYQSSNYCSQRSCTSSDEESRRRIISDISNPRRLMHRTEGATRDLPGPHTSSAK